MRSGSVARTSWWRSRAARVVALAAAGLLFTSAGALGAYRYVDNYWLYRGYDPPRDPAFVHARGTVQRIYVQSPALGGRRQPVDVYLPPGYDVAKGSAIPSSTSFTACQDARARSFRPSAWASSRTSFSPATRHGR